MYSFWTRLNAVVCYAVVLLAVLSMLNMATTLWLPAHPTAFFRIASIDTFVMHPGMGADYAAISFDLAADLRSLFNWNTKQLFVFITAEYETPRNKINQVVLWDRIIETEEEAIFDLTTERIEYAFLDQGPDLRGRKVTFSLNWDVNPIVGKLGLSQHTANSTVFVFPKSYFNRPLVFDH
eukprot:TRINITY_DN7130_c0_g1_i1.p1 TRINITY_DN7130_c0_g1~~TRINITY_DN7130_c0_g1_i1.p1  ORF type:complete len:180 (+),score=25.77 TRINITY_DN7130_c0_g1_i1:98-637(+)